MRALYLEREDMWTASMSVLSGHHAGPWPGLGAISGALGAKRRDKSDMRRAFPGVTEVAQCHVALDEYT